jgi:hypothetical protein
MNTRDKGNRVRREAQCTLVAAGYEVAIVEHSGRYVTGPRDMFGLFDMVAMSPHSKPLFLQITCNRPHHHYPFQQFSSCYPHVAVHQWVYIDRKGWKRWRYENGQRIEIPPMDLW